MNKLLTAACLISLFLLQACSKDNDSDGNGGRAINNEELARAAFGKIDALWTAVLRPALGSQAQTYSGKELQGAGGGKATVTGTFVKSSSSSFTSSLNSSTMDIVIAFDQYQYSDLRLNGSIRFYEYSYSRTACSSSGCASSSKNTSAYESKLKGLDTALSPFNIELMHNGERFKDLILMDSHKEFSTWKVDITNSDKTTFTFYL